MSPVTCRASDDDDALLIGCAGRVSLDVSSQVGGGGYAKQTRSTWTRSSGYGHVTVEVISQP